MLVFSAFYLFFFLTFFINSHTRPWLKLNHASHIMLGHGLVWNKAIQPKLKQIVTYCTSVVSLQAVVWKIIRTLNFCLQSDSMFFVWSVFCILLRLFYCSKYIVWIWTCSRLNEDWSVSSFTEILRNFMLCLQSRGTNLPYSPKIWYVFTLKPMTLICITERLSIGITGRQGGLYKMLDL